MAKNKCPHLVSEQLPDMLANMRTYRWEDDGLPLDVLQDQLPGHAPLAAQLPVLVPGRLQLEEADAQRLLEQQLVVGLVRLDQLPVHLHEENFVVEARWSAGSKQVESKISFCSIIF